MPAMRAIASASDELVASHPPHQFSFGEDAGEALRRLYQNMVSCGVAQAVVNHLDAINVDEQ